MSTEVREQIEAYFASLNPTAKRIMADISVAKEKLNTNWEALSVSEQDDALWEALVTAEVADKYTKSSDLVQTESFPVLKLKSGGKIIVDEEPSVGKPFGASWKDEHSSPFRWETQSQLNLTFCDNNNKPEVKEPTAKTIPVQEKPPVDSKKEEDVKRHLTIKRPAAPPPPVPPHATTPGCTTPPIPPHFDASPPVPPHTLPRAEGPIYAKVVKRKSFTSKTLVMSEMKAHKIALQEMKPAVPPRMSLELEIDIDPSRDCSSDSEGIPKTGFDFLDNW